MIFGSVAGGCVVAGSGCVVADLSAVDQVRAARLTLAVIDQDSDHMDAVLAECAADPYGDGVGRLVVALASQSALLGQQVSGGDGSRFFLQVLKVSTSSDVEGGGS